MIYMHRNGQVEQVRFYRTQPEHMKYVPFDFEEDSTRFKADMLDMAVFITCAMCGVGLFVWVYS